MRFWNSRAATIAIAVILCCGHALARTWTDSTGTHKIEGEFVKLADSKVDIRREDGKLVRIPLDKLSEADQQFARKAAKPPGGETPFAVVGDEEKPAAKPAAKNDDRDTQTVFAEGVGTTSEEALKDAFRAAVRQVVGEVVDGETLIKNEELVKDQVLTYSNGFIAEHKALSETHENGMFHIKIRASVQRRGVIMKLKAANIVLKTVDGPSIFGKVVTQLDEEKGADALIRKVLEGFPGDYIKSEIVGEPELVKKSQDDVTIRIKVRFRSDAAAWKSFYQRFATVLRHIARDKGEFSTKLVKGEERTPDGVFPHFHLARGNLLSVMRQGMPEAFADDPRVPANLRTGTGGMIGYRPKDNQITVAVNTLVNQSGDKLGWSYYVLDATLQPTLVAIASRQAKCKLSLVDKDENVVSVEDLPAFANGSNSNGTYPITLVAPVGTSADIDDTLRILDTDRLQRAKLFLFPAVFVRQGTQHFEQVPAAIVTREIRLTHDEVRALHHVKCELTFPSENNVKKE